ncbi:MFS transporter [Microlunatus flavus]|uniref:Predicted arabinose efflux permease, MFS family n=1 Tax=Microlunatus flavus TaxID=1036181 RepID=A0A1H9G084_9ACTN|nr:MFS transporter [Microlunatus flavus]SEQ43565.1 Predicted arabinose efflux permease, MFS family [Microlunatus flavus]
MPSPVEAVTPHRTRTVLLRYGLAAVAVRMVDAGTGVGLLLVATQRLGDPTTAARTGGLLVALFTLPHLAGPLLARRLDLARDPRRLLGEAYALVAVLLAAAASVLGRLPLLLVAGLVLLAGLGGPLLTGGLSSRLADLVPDDERSQRRAQGLDATTYGVAATAGPSLVAALAGWWSAPAAVVCLAGLGVVAALLVQTLPPRPRRPPGAVPRVRDVLPLVVRDPPLRRVNYATMVTAAAQAGLAVVVVQLAAPYAVRPSTAAVLLAASGAGNLGAALLLSVVPLRGDPDRLTTRHVAVLAGCFGLCALAPGFGWGVAAFALMGVATAPFVTATFAARTAYAPATARGQVFVTLAALKISAASGGTALAGLLVGLGPRALLVGGGAAVLLAAVLTVLDRRWSGGRPTDTDRGSLSAPA